MGGRILDVSAIARVLTTLWAMSAIVWSAVGIYIQVVFRTVLLAQRNLKYCKVCPLRFRVGFKVLIAARQCGSWA